MLLFFVCNKLLKFVTDLADWLRNIATQEALSNGWATFLNGCVPLLKLLFISIVRNYKQFMEEDYDVDNLLLKIIFNVVLS